MLLCEPGSVDHPCHGHILILQIKNATATVHTDLLIVNFKSLITELFQLLQRDPVTLHKTHEMIRFYPCCINRMQKRPLYTLAETLKDAVSLLYTKKLICCFKVLNVKVQDSISGSVLAMIQESFYHIDESPAIIGSGEIISVFLLMSGNRILDTVIQYACNKRKSETVTGSKSVCSLNICSQTCNHSDHSKLIQPLLLTHDSEEFVSINIRHLQLQKYQFQIPVFLFKDFQSLTTTSCQFYLIDFPQNIIQHFSVDL